MTKRLAIIVVGVWLFIVISMNMPTNVYAADPIFNNLDDVYRQDFDTLAPTGASKAWADNVTIVGWYANRTTYRADNGDDTTGSMYSYGTNRVAERALGSHPTVGTGTIRYGVVLTNNTGQTIPYLAVSYYGEQWLDSDTTPQKLAFSYVIGTSLDQTSLNAASGVNVPALDFISYSNMDINTKIDGNAQPTHVQGVIALATPLASGQQIMLRWDDVNDLTEDHGLAIDNLAVKLSLTPTAVRWAQSSMTVDKTSVKTGDYVRYTLRVGDTEGGSYTVTDTLPEYLTILFAPNMTINGQTVSASGTLAPNIPAIYQITVQVNRDYVGTISNSALVTDGNVRRELFAPDVLVDTTRTILYLPLINSFNY